MPDRDSALRRRYRDRDTLRAIRCHAAELAFDRREIAPENAPARAEACDRSRWRHVHAAADSAKSIFPNKRRSLRTFSVENSIESRLRSPISPRRLQSRVRGQLIRAHDHVVATALCRRASDRSAPAERGGYSIRNLIRADGNRMMFGALARVDLAKVVPGSTAIRA
jgi:hypothetical protein